MQDMKTNLAPGPDGFSTIFFKEFWEHIQAYNKVYWDFRKGFACKWINWIDYAVRGGRVAINMNGKKGEYFRSFKGLRQGHSLSPLLINMVADALAEILKVAREEDIIKGLVPDLIEGGLTHLQYANDSILFLEDDMQSITNLKFLLFYSEEMY